MPPLSAGRFPTGAEARDLIGDPFEAVDCRAQRRVLGAEGQRNNRQVIDNALLRLGIEPLAGDLVVDRPRLIEQRVDAFVAVLRGVRETLAVKENV